MTEIPITLPTGTPRTDAEVAEAVEWAVAAEGLHVHSRGSLGKYPGCIHWHCRVGGQPGTLEITWWPREQRLWLAVHSNRTAAWIERAAVGLAGRLTGSGDGG